MWRGLGDGVGEGGRGLGGVVVVIGEAVVGVVVVVVAVGESRGIAMVGGKEDKAQYGNKGALREGERAF